MTAAPAAVTAAPEGSATGLRAPEARGVTTVAPRAVRRIAAQAAGEVPGVAGPVQVKAVVRGDHALLDAEVPIRYPEPVRRVTDACRAHLTARVGELTGLRVARVEILVPALVGDAAPATGRVS
ncbi:alkaline shock response membrane anchor protein AmaP [Nocardia asteroides]|uniref:alkaline shock response membrane anchor protein AmaP n=1 Tax=Nocardia asteroides TaxID=1824 RepID=UPI001E5C6CC0|nr:alkaline shock response membrane anchor protein AmaP [Nocardia asteroides]UGT63960.1 alkaline shock response membrane anchor protein AmaP [Nocardia asteroides]